MSRMELTGKRRLVADRNLEAILDGAERLLRSGATLNFSAVAAEAGVSRPTVYAHFSDRARLVGALLDRAVAQAVEAFDSARIDDAPPVAALTRLIRVGWEHLAHHLEVAQAAAKELSIDALHAHHRGAEGLIERLIERGQTEGSFRDDLSAAWLAASCLAVIHSAAALVHSGRMEEAAAVDALVTTLVDMCVGPKSTSRRRR